MNGLRGFISKNTTAVAMVFISLISMSCGKLLAVSAAFSSGRIVDHAGFVAFGHDFTLIGDFVVQSKNMTGLTVRFHSNSLILLLVSRASPRKNGRNTT